MEKKCYAYMDRHRKLMKLILMMKATFILSVLFALQVHAGAYSQEVRMSMELESASMKQIINEIKSRTEFSFVYSDADLRGIENRNVVFKDATVEEILATCLKGTGLKFSIEEKTIVIWKEAVQQQKEVEERIVRGVVVDKQGIPLPGTTIVLKGTASGVVADSTGGFQIRLPEKGPHVLVFSFVGMKKQEIAVEKKEFIRVTMEEDSENLDDVVVTGYQTISKERATGAYSIVDAETLGRKPTSNLAQALVGLVPGLTVVSAPVDGQVRFAIRGQGTISQVSMGDANFKADNDPLIVVDGFPISGYMLESDPFASINPNDVESVTVLKDAAATSIYGARAANGVIVITTKKGKAKSKLEISADAYWSVSSRADLDYLFNMASAENQFRFEELMHKYKPINFAGNDPYMRASARRRYMSAPYSMLYERDNRKNLTAGEYDAKKQELIERGNSGTWKDDLNEYIFRRMVRQQYNVSLRGAADKLDYAFSASYDDEDSYLQENGKRRVLLNLASNARLTRNLTFEFAVNTMFSREENNGTSVVGVREWLSPWTRLKDDEGNFTHISTSRTVYEPLLMSEEYYAGKTPVDWTYNPVADREYTDNYSKTMNYRVQGGFEYRTDWGLNVSAKGQYEHRKYDKHVSYEPESFFVRDLYNTYSALGETGRYVSYFPTGGVFSNEGHTYEAYNLRGQADYSLTKDKHAFNVLAGTEVISATTEADPKVTRYGYNKYTNSVLTELDYVTKKNNIFGVSSYMPFEKLGSLSTLEDRFFSVYANAAYTYDNRYSVTASFRTDASNFQAEDVRDKFSPFWSFGASWLISNERFMERASWIDQLKLRASYGIAGVAAGKSGTSSVTTVAVHPGSLIYSGGESFNTIAERGNNTLTWEKSRTLNIGVDMAFFGHKLSGSAEFYNKYSYDVLANTTVPVISQGVESMLLNNAEIVNRGVEFSIGSDLSITGDLSWSGILNYSYNHNELKKFGFTGPYLAVGNSYVVGRPIGSFTVLKPVGYSPEGYVLLGGKDGSREPILDDESSHMMDFVTPREGQTLGDNNWAYYLGTMEPKSTLSFSNMFTWKGVTLSFMLTGQFGYYVMTSYNDSFSPNSRNLAAYSKRLDKAFEVYDKGYANQASYSELPLYNDDNKPNFLSGNGYSSMIQVSTYFRNNFIKGDYIRLNEVFLGYDLPQSLLSKQGVFSRIHVYAQASNLGLIWSANGKMDPDYPLGSLKPMPVFTFGVKLGFKSW
ncbi:MULTISPECIES: SusC/RagA family TonB-linked outer membrane protein [Butyricimonas]|uniref:SusC/RagA family TonB-linked outer membrane protein n=1 Tax=Butyricimonas TaxID=574697 RepID=UPI001D0862C4|nr:MULTISPECIES: SusC/RagA family TonB-linked outer membrane protein [Butyricimonas]MCB6971734.1 SusC/RagA family TonB-linked outer membrane protein [Butyricimonas synergistica]MCG4518659.1 SusC/RagA family TonB-linked outer membrane protein [Butyricimonas sp. DFI.6.44]